MGLTLAGCGDILTCTRNHENATAVHASNDMFGNGKDINDAVLAATNLEGNNDGLMNYIQLSVRCNHLPNMDTFTRTDAMAVLFVKKG